MSRLKFVRISTSDTVPGLTFDQDARLTIVLELQRLLTTVRSRTTATFIMRLTSHCRSWRSPAKAIGSFVNCRPTRQSRGAF